MRPPLPNGLRCEFFESVPSILPQASPVVSWTMVSRTIVELTSLPPPCIEFLGFSPRDGERLAPDRHGPAQVLLRERLDRREEKTPPLVPAMFEALARVARLQHEF